MNISNRHFFLDNTILEKAGALQYGHFLLTSGRHSDRYIEKFRLLEQPELVKQACRFLTAKSSFCHRLDFDLVVGPATGGMIVAFAMAEHNSKSAVYVERENGQMKLRRGAMIPENSKVMIVDDVLTTGLSLQEVEKVALDCGATVVGASVLVDRSEKPIEFSFPYFSAYRVEAESFDESETPEWLLSTPVTKPGTR